MVLVCFEGPGIYNATWLDIQLTSSLGSGSARSEERPAGYKETEAYGKWNSENIGCPLKRPKIHSVAQIRATYLSEKPHKTSKFEKKPSFFQQELGTSGKSLGKRPLKKPGED
jgi:hypothetical protein